MRSIFFALVAINILVFAMQWFADSPNKVQAPSVSATRANSNASLQLLGESTSRVAKGEKSSNAKTSSPTELETQGSSICTTVGPYAQLLHAEYLVERLEAMDVSAKIKAIEVPDGIGYWVYLPPEISEKEALRRLYEIQAKNIDSYIIPSGELTNGISFGMFNEQVLAQERLDEIRQLGYEAKLREVERTHSETWVELAPGEAEKIDPTVWVDLLNQQQGLEKRQNLCLGVAPEPNFH